MRTALAVCLLSASLAAQGDRVLTPEQWRADLAYFARELPRRHANAFHTTSRDAFNAAVQSLHRDIPALAPHQIAVRLLQITAQVGDGHTYVRLPRTFHALPLALNIFEDDLVRVAAVTEDTKDLFGAEVAAIGGVPIAEVRERVHTLQSRTENKWFELALTPGSLVETETLHALGVTSDPLRAEVTFTIDGAEIKRTLTGLVRDQIKMLPATVPLPLYRQRPGEPFWFEALPGARAGLYVAFRGYNDFGKNARALLARIDATKPAFVVVDLRQNTGGDFTKPREDLLPQLESRGYTGDRVYVITGRRTFSAAMVNAIDFRNVLKAILVGEPPGERPNSYQENRNMELPNSKLFVSYSTKYYKFLDQDAPAVMPDQLIAPSWRAWAEGRDEALEWISRANVRRGL